MGKSSKKREYVSDSEESSEEERNKKHKKHKKKSKKSKHKSKKKKKQHSDSSNSSSEEEWVVKSSNDKKKSESPPQPLRDDWMTSDSFILPTFTSEKTERKTIAEKSNHEIYDPATSSRELNPYYKTGEGGLPSFKRPKENDGEYSIPVSSFSLTSTRQNWKKGKPDAVQSCSRSRSPERRVTQRESPPNTKDTSNNIEDLSHSAFLNDAQMNALGAKMLKAEMMGKTKLAAELKEKLDKAKEYKKSNKNPPTQRKNNDKVLLTLPTSSGMSRPIEQREDSRDSRRHDKKQKNKRVETHEGGERTKFYPDDDRFDIKQLFEREKYSDGKDQDIEFAKAISKVKESQHMDMADIFSDNIRKDKIKKTDERDDAIREAQRMEKVLDSCYKCFDSPKMNKDLIIHVGKTIYLAIPYHEGLTPHHLIISPIQHVACSTMIDEEVWEEFKILKKALTTFFFNRKEDTIFFETVKYLNRRPHMEVQMVASKEFEMIQFYFKKAIQESEKFTVNKKLVDIKSDKSIRSSIPRGLPYFWVDFGSSGMAHMIEDQETFPSNFAQEIIGGMLNLNVNKWRKPRKEHEPAKRVQYFSSLLKNVIDNL